MTTVNCMIIRRSSNTNNFGLRGIWVLSENSRQVFSFAVNTMDAEAYVVGEFVPVAFRRYSNGTLAYPAHELAREESARPIKAADVPKFLSLFSDTLADKWNAYRQAKAIVAQTA